MALFTPKFRPGVNKQDSDLYNEGGFQDANHIRFTYGLPQPVGGWLIKLLSQLSGIPALFVRKEAKTYGTCKLAEGGDIAGKKLLIVEDVVTSGGQILLSAEDLRKLGAKIESVVCVIDRQSGGRENLAKANLQLLPLLTMSEIKTAAGVL